MADTRIAIGSGCGNVPGPTGPEGPVGPEGPPGPGDIFVFRPGGVQEENVYTNWADLFAAVSAAEGHRSIQFDDSLIKPTPIIIPPGTYDMLDVEWQGSRPRTSGNVVIQLGDNASPANDVILPNLRWMGNDIQINNRNMGTSPIVLPAVPPSDSNVTLEMGFGPAGAYFIVNTGATNAPFIDASGCLATFLRMQARVDGAGAFVSLGATPNAWLGLVMNDNTVIAAGQIVGSQASQTISVFLFGTSAAFSRQAGFAGTITHSGPTTYPCGGGFLRTWLAPFGGQPPATAPITVQAGAPNALGNPSLGMNTTLRLDTTAGAIAQPLPKIRGAAPAAGTSPVSATGVTAGVLDSTAMVVVVKNQAGANNVNVTPDGTDTIDGGAGPIAIPAGGARIFQSDGVSNWMIIGGYL